VAAAVACLFAAAAAAQVTSVQGLRLWSGPEATRVVLDLSGPAAHHVFSLSGPDRIVIDLERASLTVPLGLREAKGYVSGVRTGARPDGDLRVVLEVDRPVNPKTFLLEPNEVYGYRLVVDLLPGAAAAPRVAKTVDVVARDVVIAIDAGHGGEDPGASGPRGAREKDVVLQIARRLAEEVAREPGMRPLLIRDGDYFVSLRERTERARSAQADLFVSIHADSHRDARVTGATVYALSEKGASDEAAQRLAHRENASDLIGGVTLGDKDPMLARVLFDLSQSAAISASTAVGGHVIERLSKVAPVRKTRVQHAPFRVLKAPDIPSILVETAYISNPKDEVALRDTKYQGRLAEAIHFGVLDFFRASPPLGTHVALNPPRNPSAPVRHVISRGETLSGIAERYNVRVSTLRQFNGLTGDVIKIGQVLSIPVS
jgi:N-acetylmuramoyl-L-alanine amidase